MRRIEGGDMKLVDFLPVSWERVGDKVWRFTVRPGACVVAALLVVALLSGCGRRADPPSIERITDGNVTCWRVNDGLGRDWTCSEAKP
jgi:hypothetical protein